MISPLQSLIGTGTKLWLDSIDPELIASNRELGATGATSNPVIVADLIKTGRFDRHLETLLKQDLDDEAIAWRLTDLLVSDAEEVFLSVWQETAGNDGYVSFELDPLLEDPQVNMPHEARVARYIELGQHWSAGHENRMIKVPATDAGIDSLESLVAAGVTVNVTLIFSPRQYRAAREAVWRGAARRESLDSFKCVYSIFVSRVDVYTQEHVNELSNNAQGQVGIVNAKQIWAENQDWWADRACPLQQEMVFASTGVKNPDDPPWKYVAAFAGSDIETNPPATNEAVQASGRTFNAAIHDLPPEAITQEIADKVDMEHLEATLMKEGVRKFADPQRALLKLIAQKRAALLA